MAWAVMVFNEMVNPHFELKNWEKEIKAKRPEALTKHGSGCPMIK